MGKKNSEKVNIEVKIGDGIPVDKALKKFKRLCDQFGIIKEYRKREAHQKRSVKMKEKREAAEKRRKKSMRGSGYGRKI